MRVEQLLALDDSAARIEAARELASAIVMSPAFTPLRRSQPPTTWLSQSRWMEDLGNAALRGWIESSGLGWLRTSPPDLDIPFEAYFHPVSPTHRQVATSLYLWALPENCRAGDVRLSDFLSDRSHAWGDELATMAASDDHLGRLATLDGSRQIAAAASILGKLHWLAPTRIPFIAEALAAKLSAYASAPLPSPESRAAIGFILPFYFEPLQVRAFLEPMMAETIHSAMSFGDIDLPEYSWTASQSAALGIPQIDNLTLTSFAAGVNRLSVGEQALLTEALLKAMPLLSKAIGPFVEPALKDLYNAAHANSQL